MKNIFDFDKNMSVTSAQGKSLRWHDAKEEAFGAFGSDALSEYGFFRMTEAERNYIRPINDGEAWLGEHSAGIGLQFETDSTQLFLHIKNRSKFDMTNMTLTGQTGVDMYVYDEETKSYRLHEVARGKFDDSEFEMQMGHFSDRPKRRRRYLMYLPPVYVRVGTENRIRRGRGRFACAL